MALTLFAELKVGRTPSGKAGQLDRLGDARGVAVAHRQSLTAPFAAGDIVVDAERLDLAFHARVGKTQVPQVLP